MSRIDQFETAAKVSTAISLLNKARHWLQEREPKLPTKERELLRQSLQLLESKDFAQMVVLSFKGTGYEGCVLPLSIAFGTVLKGDEDIATLKKVVDCEFLPEKKIVSDCIAFFEQAIESLNRGDRNASLLRNT